MPAPSPSPALRLDAEQLLRSLAEGVLVVDPESLTIRVANNQAEVVTGFAIAELVGRSLAELRSGGDGAEAVALESLVHLPGRHDEVHLRRRDGTGFIASVHVTLAEEEGRPLAILLLHDVSERRRLERELLTKHAALGEAYREVDQKNRELREANEALDQKNEELRRANEEIRTAQRWLAQLEKMATVGRFAAGVAHEVNNPMAFVLENLQRLQDHVAAVVPALRAQLDAQTGGGRDAVRTAVQELESIVDESLQGARRVSGIVRQLHSFSNVGDQEAEWVDLREVVESAIMMVKNQILQRARLERHYFDARRVSGVAGQLGQVMVNVLVNAVQAIPEGNVDRNCIWVRLRPVGEHVALEVQDTGVGIPAEHLPQILEPFFTTKPAGTGSGLGLSISARIVEQHGGRIEVESTVGTGTVVRIILPVRGKLRARRPSGATAPTVTASARLNLLVVDDELFLLRALKRNLSRDHEVETAASAAEALAYLAEHPEVDVVIADMMMPDEDGVSLYERAVVAHPHLRERFVFMTGGVFTDRVREFLERVSLTVLSKPIRREDLQQAIASFTRVPGSH